MPVTSGKGRVLNGSGGDRVKRNNLTEFRGSGWEMVNDWFFGISTVDYDWDTVTDEDRIVKWIYTQDDVSVSEHTVFPDKHELDIALTAGPDPVSNQREMFTIPESGLWGIAHVLVEIKAEAYDAGIALPQHGLGLRAQEDTKRRAIVAWHDVFVGNPHAINVGVWQGNLDGSGFTNRQGNAALDLKQIYNITSGSRVGGVVTAVTSVAHEMVIDDYLNISWTKEFPGSTLNRASNVVTATLGSGHGMQTGDIAFLFGAGTFSGTFTVTGFNATQITWAQVGANEGGSGTVKDRSSDVRQVKVIEIPSATTFKYTDGKHDLAVVGTSATGNERLFPYWMEVRVSGTILQVRCWSRHQSLPGWTDPNHAFTIDLDKAHLTYTVTASSRTGGTATLTIGSHDFMVGNIITVDVTDAGLDTLNGFVTGINATQVMYESLGADIAVGGTGTCVRKGGADAAADIATIPTPRGTGRVAVAAAHEGIVDYSHCSYGGIVGTNSSQSFITSAGQAVETEMAQPIARVKTRMLGQAVETETAGRIRPGDWPVVSEAETAVPTNSTSHVVNMPAGSGGLLLALQSYDARPIVSGDFADNWVSLGNTAHSGDLCSLRGYYKIADGSEGATETAITDVAQTSAHKVWRLTNVDLTVPPEVAVFQGNTSTSLDSPALNPTGWAIEKIVSIAAAAYDSGVVATTAYPAGYVDGAAVNSGDAADGVSLAYALQVLTTGSEDPGPFTIASTEEYCTATFAVKWEAGLVMPPFNQVTETEIAQPIARLKTKAVAQAVEVEVAQPVTRVKARTLAQTVETEVATLSGRLKARVVAQALENEVGQTFTRVKAKPLTQALETETATVTGRLKTRVAAQAVETETALVVTGRKLLAIGQATETEVAQAVARLKSKILAQAVELETGQVIDVLVLDLMRQVVELETAQPITAVKTRSLLQAVETEAAQAVVRVKSRLVAQGVETETAFAIARLKMRALVQAVEMETALTIVAPGQLRLVTETEIAQPFTRVKSRVLAQAVETETATAVARLKTRLVGQAIEVEIARLFTQPGRINTALETEIAMPFTALKRKAIAQVVETEAAQAFAHVKGHVLGQAQEMELAQAWLHSKLRLVAQVVETESGLTIVRLLPPPDELPSGVGTGGGGIQGRTSSRHGARSMVTNGKVTIL